MVPGTWIYGGAQHRTVWWPRSAVKGTCLVLVCKTFPVCTWVQHGLGAVDASHPAVCLQRAPCTKPKDSSLRSNMLGFRALLSHKKVLPCYHLGLQRSFILGLRSNWGKLKSFLCVLVSWCSFCCCSSQGSFVMGHEKEQKLLWELPVGPDRWEGYLAVRNGFGWISCGFVLA